jgi:hypothetical protein
LTYLTDFRSGYHHHYTINSGKHAEPYSIQRILLNSLAYSMEFVCDVKGTGPLWKKEICLVLCNIFN